jgi:hypothetical protein
MEQQYVQKLSTVTLPLSSVMLPIPPPSASLQKDLDIPLFRESKRLKVVTSSKYERTVVTRRAFKAGEVILADERYSATGDFCDQPELYLKIAEYIRSTNLNDPVTGLLHDELKVKRLPYDHIYKAKGLSMDMIHLAGTAYTNTYNDYMIDPVTNVSSITIILFPRFSYINHSCSPNSILTLHNGFLRAAKDIVAGIIFVTINYIIYDVFRTNI